MNIPQKALEKYIKIRQLALRGEAGEQNVARLRMTKMEQDYPSIAQQANLWEKTEEDDWSEDEPRYSSEPPSQHWSDVYESPQEETRWKHQFSQWGKMASNAFSWAAGVAEHAFSVRQAQMLATEKLYTQIKMKHQKSGSFTINIRLSPETISYIEQYLTAEQKMIFSNTLAQRLAEELYGKVA